MRAMPVAPPQTKGLKQHVQADVLSFAATERGALVFTQAHLKVAHPISQQCVRRLRHNARVSSALVVTATASLGGSCSFLLQ